MDCEEHELYGYHEKKVLLQTWEIVSAQMLREDYYLEEWPNT
jgi:hypothetical protein